MDEILLEVAREGGTYVFVCAFYDDRGVAIVPDSVVWSLTNGAGDTIINSRNQVTVTPAASIKVYLTGADLAMFTELPREPRKFKLEATWNSGRSIVETRTFYVARS